MLKTFMLLLGIITLVMTIPLASHLLSTILIHRIAFLILLYSSLLSYNTLYVIPLSSGIGILGGLFQQTILSQSIEIFILIIGGIILLLAPEEKGIKTKLVSFYKGNINDSNKTTTLWDYWDNLSSNVKEVLSTSNKTNNSVELKDYPLIILFTTLGMILILSNFPETNDILVLSNFVPVMIYDNAETDKNKILKGNKGKAGIYMWTHLESGKRYIGSSVDLSKRFSNYFSKSYLNRNKSMYICNALILHDYSSFSLAILAHINISDSPKDESKNLILSIEQYYLNTFNPEYNILFNAGNLLGFKHSEGTLVKMRGKNNSRFGRTHTAESLTKMSEAKKGKTLSTEAKAKLSEARKGKTHTAETKAKIGLAQSGVNTTRGKKVFVYCNSSLILTYEFVSCTEAAKLFSCSKNYICNYLKNGKIFKKQWILSSTKK